ncbi:hypothetical protein CUMW_162700 [Citrus unshiu]|nr:hypothetical protein CUMW_162700 [Citrus unshiu]
MTEYMGVISLKSNPTPIPTMQQSVNLLLRGYHTGGTRLQWEDDSHSNCFSVPVSQSHEI